jgi:hypothetical protein
VTVTSREANCFVTLHMLLLSSPPFSFYRSNDYVLVCILMWTVSLTFKRIFTKTFFLQVHPHHLECLMCRFNTLKKEKSKKIKTEEEEKDKKQKEAGW